MINYICDRCYAKISLFEPMHVLRVNIYEQSRNRISNGFFDDIHFCKDCKLEYPELLGVLKGDKKRNPDPVHGDNEQAHALFDRLRSEGGAD